MKRNPQYIAWNGMSFDTARECASYEVDNRLDLYLLLNVTFLTLLDYEDQLDWNKVQLVRTAFDKDLGKSIDYEHWQYWVAKYRDIEIRSMRQRTSISPALYPSTDVFRIDIQMTEDQMLEDLEKFLIEHIGWSRQHCKNLTEGLANGNYYGHISDLLLKGTVNAKQVASFLRDAKKFDCDMFFHVEVLVDQQDQQDQQHPAERKLRIVEQCLERCANQVIMEDHPARAVILPLICTMRTAMDDETFVGLFLPK